MGPHSNTEAADRSLSADVLVIGGGVIGLSIAWRAAQQGQRVVVADPEPGLGATHAAAGMLTPIAEAAYAEREVFGLGQDSLRRYPDFVAELHAATGLPTGFRQDGTLQVAYDSDDLAVLTETRLLQESFGVHLTQLTARECREAEPMLDPAVRGGLLAPADGSVDPRLLATALERAAEGAGARIVRQRVGEVLCSAGRATGVRLADDSVLSARWIVLAAGWQSGHIPGLPGRDRAASSAGEGPDHAAAHDGEHGGGRPAARTAAAHGARRRPRL